MQVNGENTGSYLYAFVKRIIISENLYIIVLPNLVVLPIRHGAIPEEKWNIIQQCINSAMAVTKEKPRAKKADKPCKRNRFTSRNFFILIILLCSLFLIPYKDIEAIEVAADDKSTASIYGNMVSEQSFDLSLNDWGSVTFVSCMPDPDADADPLTDASWSQPTITVYVPTNGDYIQEITVNFDEHGYSESFYAEFEELCFYTLKVLFPDMPDKEIIALYEEANHLGNMNVFLNENGYKKGCVPCVLYHKDGIGIYPYFAIGEWVHLCIIPVTQEIIDDYAQKGVEIREIE